MSMVYTESHEWARADGEEIVVGISSFAAGEVGEIIHVELPKPGTTVNRGKGMAEIESVKSVNDIYAPVDGEISAINEALADKPELVNEDPSGAGWLVRIKPSGDQPLAGLMDEAAYEKHTQS